MVLAAFELPVVLAELDPPLVALCTLLLAAAFEFPVAVVFEPNVVVSPAEVSSLDDEPLLPPPPQAKTTSGLAAKYANATRNLLFLRSINVLLFGDCTPKARTRFPSDVNA